MTSLDGCLKGLGYIGCGAAGMIAGMSTVSGELANNIDSIVGPTILGIVISHSSGLIDDHKTNAQLRDELRKTKEGIERECICRPAKAAACFAGCYVLGAGLGMIYNMISYQ